MRLGTLSFGAALFAPLALAAGLSHAAPARAGQGPYAAFCSDARTDGRWAFGWGNADVQYECGLVYSALNDPAPDSGFYDGYYWVEDFNDVRVQCAFGLSASFNGYGAQPLEDAYQWGNQVAGQECLFQVD